VSIRPEFDHMYRSDEGSHGLPAATPWDIGAPQPVIEKLVAYGAVRGDVLDPGTGPGHHAIYYASEGFSVTGIDGSAAAIDRAKTNAASAGVAVNFVVGDATKLEGYDAVFDTVVDSAFYHVFADDTQTQSRYLEALHRATRPKARLYMFEFGGHNVNGITLPNGIAEENFRELLPAAGWGITYLGPTTYQANISVPAMEQLAAQFPDRGGFAERLLERVRVIEPLLVDGRIHAPFWEVHATRVD
jgi:SAM-dependent methyltransferase